MNQEQFKITKEEVDWKCIAESLGEENKKLKATVVPAVENLHYYLSESAKVVKDKKDGQGRRMKMFLQDQLLMTLLHAEDHDLFGLRHISI